MMRSLYSKALGLLLGGVLIASCSQKELVTADYQDLCHCHCRFQMYLPLLHFCLKME